MHDSVELLVKLWTDNLLSSEADDEAVDEHLDDGPHQHQVADAHRALIDDEVVGGEEKAGY